MGMPTKQSLRQQQWRYWNWSKIHLWRDLYRKQARPEWTPKMRPGMEMHPGKLPIGTRGHAWVYGSGQYHGYDTNPWWWYPSRGHAWVYGSGPYHGYDTNPWWYPSRARNNSAMIKYKQKNATRLNALLLAGLTFGWNVQLHVQMWTQCSIWFYSKPT
jgi:hypothetical protein